MKTTSLRFYCLCAWLVAGGPAFAAETVVATPGWAFDLAPYLWVPTATLCQGALLRAIASGVAVYDTLFIELAVRARCRLLTFDKALLRAFPDVATRPRNL